jgi:hypothetical protein
MTKKEAVKVVEGAIEGYPEIRAIRRKQTAIERKHASVAEYHFCQECATWTPEEPPAIKALDKEWMRIFKREVERVRKTKAATK